MNTVKPVHLMVCIVKLVTLRNMVSQTPQEVSLNVFQNVQINTHIQLVVIFVFNVKTSAMVVMVQQTNV